MSRPSFRAVWTLIDKILNKSLDLDARISHPEPFSTFATNLDGIVRTTLVEVDSVADLIVNEERCLRLKIERGGCGISSAKHKMHFSHLASACEVLPAVGKHLCGMGWSEQSVENVVDFVGVDQCLSLLEYRGIFLAVDGGIHFCRPTSPMNKKSILWGQARKLFGSMADKLQELDGAELRSTYDPHSRHIARFNSASGATAGKWLDAFPISRWPEFSDDAFIMVLTFRSGIPVVVLGRIYMHSKCKEQSII